MKRRPQTIVATPPMTRSEEPGIIAKAKAGDHAAIARILSSLVKLVAFEAHRWHAGDADEQDLIQAGLMGVMHAIGKFDDGFGVRFSTYAQHWWTQYIRRESRLQFAAGRSGAKSILFTRYYPLKKIMDAAQDSGEDPACAMVAAGWRRDIAEGFVAMHHKIASLDAAASDGDVRTLENVLADPREPVDQALGRRARDKAVRIAVNSLPQKMRNVIYWRRLTRHPMSFEEIGQQFGVTPQRAQQIEILALEKLRARLGGVNA